MSFSIMLLILKYPRTHNVDTKIPHFFHLQNAMTFLLSTVAQDTSQ